MNLDLISQIRKVSQKIAMELVFAEAGKDNGLLPVNSLLSQLEELTADESAPPEFRAAAGYARRWIDSIFDTTGVFGGLALKRLNQWAAWWEEALNAAEMESAAPALPKEWNQETQEASAPDTQPHAASEGRIETPQEEPRFSLNLEEDAELLREFINESEEHLQNIEQGVLVLEENPADGDTLNSIFRAFHTFKGGSGFLNLTAIQGVAHELESLLDLARQHKIDITPEVIDVILEGGDTLKRFVGEIAAQVSSAKPPGPIVVPTLRLLAEIRRILAGESKNAAAEPGVSKAASAPAGNELKERVASAPSVPAPAPAPAPALAKTLPAENTQKPPGPGAESGGAPRGMGGGTAVKVDTMKLDTLVDLVGEMVIAQSLVVQNGDLRSVQSEQLTRDLAQLGRITKELQRTAMALRMVPIRSTFQKMNRLVRDITAKVGKQVELVTEGEDTELDRTIVEEISDPLVHMIRNSVDHGIEKPEIRIQRGKPAQGKISLRAYHQGGNIVIEIRDDGNGLDRDRIFAKAVEKGILKPDQQLPDSEIFSLIFAAGFSTAEKVTDLSGRGVGMDVVRRNIERLRGKIEIQSSPGQGSTFSIHLPLTLAIIDGLLIGVGNQRYVVPTLSVCESFRPHAGMITTVHGRGEMINVRGRLRPLLRLYEHLGLEPLTTDPLQSIIVLVESGKSARCILVDQLLGKQEVVIKSLGPTFSRNPSVAGAAILGDGKVGLILDPQALVHLEAASMEAAA